MQVRFLLVAQNSEGIFATRANQRFVAGIERIGGVLVEYDLSTIRCPEKTFATASVFSREISCWWHSFSFIKIFGIIFLMTPEEKELLNRIAETVEENNHMLHAVRRSMRWSSIMRWVYWIIIIGTSIGAFWLIQPYLNAIGGGASNTSSLFQQYKDLLKQ